jgi:hypothetical protein
VGIFALKEQQLRDDQVRDVIVDRRSDKNDPILEQARINIVSALPLTAFLDNHRD